MIRANIEEVDRQLKKVVDLLLNLIGLVPHGKPNGIILQSKKKRHLLKPNHDVIISKVIHWSTAYELHRDRS